MVGRLLAFVLPLGLDSFATAAALAAAGPLTRARRWRISALFVLFEGGMPLLGLAAGAPLARGIGSVADYVAAGVLLVLGCWMLLGDDEQEEEKAGKLTAAHGLAVLGLGISISLDELAVGFSLGLTRLPVIIVILAIAAQALLASQLGLYLGTRIGDRLREGAERLAGIALVGLGLYLLIARLTG